ncbi:hypothetical protein ACFOY8_14670 [Thalassospira xianhensis]|uniref:Uncharacterized protein n=1 Tax=Thalassospira xianhensis MCCC 1A02616 TaxID=1177929 RepID=A0A367UHC3_9PROT|nr:hypothetical protein [Thalassospira xianhensis]RCK07608.1 hypothetical protein TH5_00570 [Thalassospira xianhensis MCCC 1A02616]
MSAIDWYERRDELEQGQIFRTVDGNVVILDHRAEGDGTKWTVGCWASRALCFVFEEDTVEPGDLEARLPADFTEQSQLSIKP